MPEIARLHGGITIHIYYGDHNPPHFHAKGADWMIRVNIVTGTVLTISGSPPKGIEGELTNFAATHQNQLALCWAKCQVGVKPGKITP